MIGSNILQDGSLTVGSQEGRGLIGPDNPIVANPQTALINGDLELRDNGLISVSAGGSELTMQMGTLDNNGIIFVNGAKAVIDDPVTGTGGIDLGSDFAKDVGKLEFGSSVGHGQFIGLNAGNLQLDQPMQFAGSMSFLSGLNNEPPAPAISPQILLWKILS